VCDNKYRLKISYFYFVMSLISLVFVLIYLPLIKFHGLYVYYQFLHHVSKITRDPVHLPPPQTHIKVVKTE